MEALLSLGFVIASDPALTGERGNLFIFGIL